MSYRLRTEEIDLSGFNTQSNSQVAAIVLKSRKGGKTPKLTRGENQVIQRFGRPNAEFFGVFEAIEYCRSAPAWIVCALGAGYKYAGVDVRTNSVVPFGSRSGRVFETFSNNSYSAVQVNSRFTAQSSADGLTKSFNGTISPSGNLPAIASTVLLRVGANSIPVTVDTNTNAVTSDAFETPGTFNVDTGVYNITFKGSVGTKAVLTSLVPITSNVDLSSNGTNKLINLEIDGTLYQNINLGASGTTTKAAIVAAINAAVGYTAAEESGNFITITARIASSNLGYVKVSPPSAGDSAVPLVFTVDATTLEARNSTSPTEFVPKFGESVIWDYNYLQDVKSDTSFSLFMDSPFDDSFESYSLQVSRVSNKRYRAVLYQNTTFGQGTIKTYNFSLIREKDDFGKSLYYEDVFNEDDYLKIFVNTDYTNIAEPVVQIVTATGGERGAEPQASDYIEAWANFQKSNTYKVKNMLDFYGNSATTLRNVIDNYQPFAFGLTVVPFGNNAVAAKAYRQNLGIDFDGLALYTNWLKIEDSYNNSFAWTSGIGKVGVKYAQMNNVFDGLAPAGVDENGRGGQLSGFRVIQSEFDYADDSDSLQLLNEAQINPLVLDQFYGPMAFGNRTLQVSNSDTSFINHRRLYNYIIENVSTQILKKQIFKLNDDLHRLLAKTQTETFLAPIDALDLVREVYVQCDTDNNNDDVLAVREFILDIYVKITPTSEFVILRLTRLPQGGVISDFLAAA